MLAERVAGKQRELLDSAEFSYAAMASI